MVNAAGELVGLVFDGNVESFIGRFFYDDTANRTVSVHSAAMIEAMKKIYGAEKLVQGDPRQIEFHSIQKKKAGTRVPAFFFQTELSRSLIQRTSAEAPFDLLPGLARPPRCLARNSSTRP